MIKKIIKLIRVLFINLKYDKLQINQPNKMMQYDLRRWTSLKSLSEIGS